MGSVASAKRLPSFAVHVTSLLIIRPQESKLTEKKCAFERDERQRLGAALAAKSDGLAEGEGESGRNKNQKGRAKGCGKNRRNFTIF